MLAESDLEEWRPVVYVAPSTTGERGRPYSGLASIACAFMSVQCIAFSIVPKSLSVQETQTHLGLGDAAVRVGRAGS